jgi:hypothetical protein
MVSFWLAIGIWGLASLVWVELVRDTYHALAHAIPWLLRLHNWHHRVFRPDLTPVSTQIYRQAQWYNDVPESLVMIFWSLALWAIAYWVAPEVHWGALVGPLYALSFLVGAIARGSGIPGAAELTDLTHMPGTFDKPPTNWFVNRSYHWRHHFDNQNAYFSGAFALVDKVLGTALSLKGKTVAVTGASGTMGRALLHHLYRNGAKPIALSSKNDPISIEIDGNSIELKTVCWQVGAEDQLAEFLEKVDILVLNHGINVHGDRTQDAIAKSYEINAFSNWRLMELFLTTVRTNAHMAKKEIWVNTSEAEVGPAFSPLYELSKRTLGDLVTLRRLDAPCVIRKIVLGPFRSNLNPIGVMSGNWVAKQVVNAAKRDTRNIIVTINPLTLVAFPLREFAVSLYFRWFSHQAPVEGNDSK